VTELVENRELALRVGYEATDWTTPISFEQYLLMMADWDVKAIVRDDKCIGAAYFNGDELHVSILPEWRRKWATKGLLSALFAKDRVTTRVMPGHDYMHGVLQRLGFIQHDGHYVRGH
jgi:hypothetical protein